MKSEIEKLREKQQRRRRKRLVRILLISPLIALVFVAALSLLSRINTVVLRNSTVYSSLEIAEKLPFSVGDSLFAFQRDKVSDEITVNCPYVKEARINYAFPTDLTIDLTPATVAFAVRTEKEVLLIDRDFKVLEVVDRLPEGVVSIDGLDLVSYTVGYPLSEDENIQVSNLREMLAELDQRGILSHTASIDMSKKYNISLQIYGVITVYLGNAEDLDAKMNMLVKILNENDLTVPAEIRVRNPAEGRYARLDLPDPPSDSSTDSDQNDGISTGNG